MSKEIRIQVWKETDWMNGNLEGREIKKANFIIFFWAAFFIVDLRWF